MKQTLVVVGGGAAGFFCAVNAARLNANLHVIITEKTNKLLAKVRVSGGGRCNVTHACFDILALIKKYPRGANFLKKSFHQFNTTHCVQWFEDRGVQLKAEADGRMFSITNTSQTIIDCLLSEANRFGVEVLMNSEVKRISVKETQPNDEKIRQIKFTVELANDKKLLADHVCVACGGYPKSAMFNWLADLGHTIKTPVPALFTFNIPRHPITQLMGISVENVLVKIGGSKLGDSGPLLITHWGLSGPAILKLSAWGARELSEKNYDFTLFVCWVPSYTEQTLRTQWQDIRNRVATQKMGNKNPFNLPARLWVYLLNESGINEDIRWADLPAKEQNKLIKNLTGSEFEVKGKTTFKEEFVTCGGVSLNEINAGTMESKIVSDLYFAGEIMDVDGVTGGFNFQHAWTSGWIAAKAIAEKMNTLS